MSGIGWEAVGQVLIKGYKKADIESCRKVSRTAVDYVLMLPHSMSSAFA